jgi:hypothetical protein
MITKFLQTISSEKFFTVIFSFLILSYPVICHCVRIHISTRENRETEVEHFFLEFNMNQVELVTVVLSE